MGKAVDCVPLEPVVEEEISRGHRVALHDRTG